MAKRTTTKKKPATETTTPDQLPPPPAVIEVPIETTVHDQPEPEPTPAPTPTPAPEPGLVVVPDLNAVINPPPPPPVVAPTTIELQRSGETGKHYVSKTDPNSKYHLRDRSDIAKPVAVVRAICQANPTASRKSVIEACIANGVNKNTAMTQYSLWRAKYNREAAIAAANAANTQAGDPEKGDGPGWCGGEEE